MYFLENSIFQPYHKRTEQSTPQKSKALKALLFSKNNNILTYIMLRSNFVYYCHNPSLRTKTKKSLR